MKAACPKCDSEKVIPIIDGDPSNGILEKAARKGADRSGYLMRRNSPEYICLDCGTKWTRKRAEGRDPTLPSNRTLTGR
jgi:hypothetical protein